MNILFSENSCLWQNTPLENILHIKQHVKYAKYLKTNQPRNDEVPTAEIICDNQYAVRLLKETAFIESIIVSCGICAFISYLLSKIKSTAPSMFSVIPAVLQFMQVRLTEKA